MVRSAGIFFYNPKKRRELATAFPDSTEWTATWPETMVIVKLDNTEPIDNVYNMTPVEEWKSIKYPTVQNINRHKMY